MALLVLVAFGGAGWLFWGERGSTESGTPAQPAETTPSGDQAEGVLELPDAEEPTDERRRGQDGRDRLDPNEVGSASDPATNETPPLDADLPASFANLRDQRIVVTAASSAGTGAADADALVAAGSLKVACAALGDGAALKVELALAERIEALLDRAGAAQPATARAAASTCVDSRVKSARDADLAIVLHAGAGTDEPRVRSGRPTGAADPRSTTLAAELAAALELDAVTPSRSAADRTLLAQAGAIDEPRGAAIALVEPFSASEVSSDDLDALAMSIVGALAVVAARADQ